MSLFETILQMYNPLDKTLKLEAWKIGSKSTRDLFKELFGKEVLILQNVFDAPIKIGSRIIFKGSCAEQLLQNGDLTFELKEVKTNMAALLIKVAFQSETWKFSDTFPELKRTLWDHVTFKDNTILVMTSEDYHDIEQGTEKCEKIRFYGDIDFSKGILKNLQWLKKQDPSIIVGTIQYQKENFPVIRIQVLKTLLSNLIQNENIPLTVELVNDKYERSGIQVTAQIREAGTVITLASDIMPMEEQILELQGIIPNSLSLTKNLLDLVESEGPLKILRDSSNQILTLNIDTYLLENEYLELNNRGSIIIIPELIVIDDVQNTGANNFKGNIQIGDKKLPVEGTRTPLKVLAKLPEGSEVKLIDLLLHFKLPQWVPVVDTKVTELNLEALRDDTSNPIRYKYSLSFGLKEWMLVPDSSLKMENVRVKVEYDSELEPKWSGEIEGELPLSGSKIDVRGTVTEEHGWKFMPPNPISVQMLLEWLGFEKVKTPDLILNYATFMLNTKDSVFYFSANEGKVFFIACKNPEQPDLWVVAFGAKLTDGFSLNQLPLIGDKLPAEESLALKDIYILTASSTLNKELVALLNQKIKDADESGGAEIPQLPSEPINEGVSLEATLHIGNEKRPLNFPIFQSNNILANGLDIMKWEPIQKSLGPLTFKRIGIRFQGNELFIMLDAEMKTGGLIVTLNGLGASCSLQESKLNYHLEGLGIEYKGGPLEISGTLLAISQGDSSSYKYDGMVIVKTQGYSFSGIASYEKLSDREPSLFVFVYVDGNFGGPPFFYVIGIAGGFGYNRELKIPEYNQVEVFPLIQSMEDPTLNVLEALENGEWIEPKLGTDWLAAGVKFLTFGVMSSRVVAAANLSDEFSLSVLGISQLDLPKPTVEVINEDQIRFTHLKLQLNAELKPQDGVFRMKGTLTDDSYVLNRNCKVTGSFAFFFWFDGNYKGDFVVTVGGYHADFRPPNHYPAVNQRLALNWPIGDGIAVKGESYFALTPSCAMTGGKLEVRFDRSGIEAWFSTNFNVLMHWKPLYIEANIGVRVGVAATIKWKKVGFRKRYVIEVSADLELWGPSFGGEVIIDCWIAEFRIPIGAAKNSHYDRYIEWEEFAEMLPKEILKLHVSDGLIREETDEWVVRPDVFTFFSQTAIPVTDIAVEIDKDNQLRRSRADEDLLNIRPLGEIYGENLTSNYFVSVTTQESSLDVLDDPKLQWEISLITSNVPEALWGAPSDPVNGAEMVEDQWMGLQLQAPKTPDPYQFICNLGFDNICNSHNQIYDRCICGRLPFEEDIPQVSVYTSYCSVEEIGKTIMQEGVKKNRNDIYAVLKELKLYEGDNGPLDEFAKDTGAYLSAPPLMQI
ncbi:hypothetical protein P4V58_11540 [Bacillus wiedmannii]|uniref:DUF6603 domain-containing protein n=1 Tax=Bacillus wiedmannii TaxID=1890302 RepID=UPI002E23D169|nr:hypothetical protein [Bacillus wiedmannii]